MVIIQVRSQIVTVAHTSPRRPVAHSTPCRRARALYTRNFADHAPAWGSARYGVVHGVWSYGSAAVSTAGSVHEREGTHPCALTTGRCHPWTFAQRLSSPRSRRSRPQHSTNGRPARTGCGRPPG